MHIIGLTKPVAASRKGNNVLAFATSKQYLFELIEDVDRLGTLQGQGAQGLSTGVYSHADHLLLHQQLHCLSVPAAREDIRLFCSDCSGLMCCWSSCQASEMVVVHPTAATSNSQGPETCSKAAQALLHDAADCQCLYL